jgi:hypothetical protein
MTEKRRHPLAPNVKNLILLGMARQIAGRLVRNEMRVRELELETGARAEGDDSGFELPTRKEDVAVFVKRALGIPPHVNGRHPKTKP